jgi:proline iminopeptidase
MKNLRLVFAAVALVAVTLISCDTLEPNDPGLLVPLTVDEDASLPSIFVNGTHFHAETFGNPVDPMIVVLHGGPGGDYRSMLSCSSLSSDGFFVVFYDQRGSGLSRRHNKDVYTTEVFVNDLDGIIRYYRKPGQKVILMGLSWGAMLATSYINEHPDDVDGAVLMEPGGFTWHDTEEYIKRWRTLKPFDETSNDYVYLDQIITGDQHAVLDYKAGIQSAADFAGGNKLGNPGPSPFWRMGAVCNTASLEYAQDHPFDFTTHLGQYTTKVLFMYSEFNQAYGRTHAEHVSSAYPNVELVQINGTGHDMIYFGWNAVSTAARAYLNTFK